MPEARYNPCRRRSYQHASELYLIRLLFGASTDHKTLGDGEIRWMRKFILACAILPYAGTASAAEQGLASYYCPSSGGLVAAHRSLAIGSQVHVVNLDYASP